MSSGKCDAQSATKFLTQKHRVIQLIVLFSILSVPGFSTAQSHPDYVAPIHPSMRVSTPAKGNPYVHEAGRIQQNIKDIKNQIQAAKSAGDHKRASRLAEDLYRASLSEELARKNAETLNMQDLRDKSWQKAQEEQRAAAKLREQLAQQGDLDVSVINRRTADELRVVLPSSARGVSGWVTHMPDEATRMRALTVIRITERINPPHRGVRDFAPTPTELRALNNLRDKLIQYMHDNMGHWTHPSDNKLHVDKLRAMLNSSEVFKRYAEVLTPDTLDGLWENPEKSWIVDNQRAKPKGPKGVAKNVKGAVDSAAAKLAEGQVKANAVKPGKVTGKGKGGRRGALAAGAIGLGVISAGARADQLSENQNLAVTERLKAVQSKMSNAHLSESGVPTAGVD